METDNVLAPDFATTFETVEKQEETRLRSIIKENTLDFDAWMELVKHIESYVKPTQKAKDLNIQIYKEILQEYPLCFGYWRKLADIYASQNQDDLIIHTYEESLKYLPVCIEIWSAYCNWKSLKKPEDEARALFERAINSSGKSFKSSVLWDKYLDFEKSKKRSENLGALYYRVLHVPNEKLHDYYGKFKLFIDAKGRKLDHYGAVLPARPDSSTLSLDASDPHYETKAEMHYSAICEVNRQTRVKEVITLYENTLKEYNKRRGFEAGIKRTFFHVKSLDEQQLETWRKYLEFEENEGNHERIVLLYERCIVPLCYYSEFWERYARYIYKVHGEDAARAVFQRGIQKFVKRRPELYLAQGCFEEGLGKLDAARGFYREVYEKIVPGLFDAIFRHLNLEKRCGDVEAVEKIYGRAFRVAYESEQDSLVAFVTNHYARYSLYVKEDTKGVIEVYEKVLSEVRSKKSLYLAYIQSLVHESDRETRLKKTRETYEKAIGEDSEVIFMHE